MRKLTAFMVALCILTPITAQAETIYTESAVEYSSLLHELKEDDLTPKAPLLSVMSDEDTSARRRLLVYYEGELDPCGALHDIVDGYDIHTLIYASEADADNAFDHYTEAGIPVCRDEMLNVDSLSWGYDTIGTSFFTNGLRDTYGSVSKMPEITVAVIDTGIYYNHTFLKGRVDASRGYDFYNDDYDATDDNNHGTHVAGIIADNTLANVTIIPIKVANSGGSMTTSDLKSGIQHANELGVDIINLSLGSAVEDKSRSAESTFYSLFNTLHNNGTVICAAAGNAYNGVIHNSNYIFPAYMDHTIVVANSTEGGYISNYSNYGTVIDIAAPGTNIKSTIINNKYTTMSGTSMSCPFAVAAAALLMTRDPDITPDEIESEIRSNAAAFPDEFYDYYYGRYGTGILNMGNYYLDDPTPTPAPASPGVPVSTPSPTPTPVPTSSPLTWQLISNVKYSDNNHIKADISNRNGILKSGAVAIVAGYNDGILKKFDSKLVTSESDAIMDIYFKNAESFDEIKLYVWRSIGTQTPLSEPYPVRVSKVGGEYIVTASEK